MFDGTRKRLAMLRNRYLSPATRVFAFLEVFCFYFSFAALLFLAFDLVMGSLTDFELSGPARAILSVSLTAAIGFLTNWLAIEMLFRPYKPIGWFPVWPQGLVPRNQKQIGVQAGEAIKSELLDPEKIADRLCDCVSASLESEEFRREAAEQILEYLRATLKEALSAQIDKMPPPHKPVLLDLLAIPARKVYDNLRTGASGAVDRFLDSPKMTEWLNSRFIPSVRPSIESFVRDHLPDVLEKIDLGELIAEEIGKIDPREFHALVNSVAAESLGAIQVLGFILGGLIGALMLLRLP